MFWPGWVVALTPKDAPDVPVPGSVGSVGSVPPPVQVRAPVWRARAVLAPSVAVNWPEPLTVTPLPDWMSQ